MPGDEEIIVERRMGDGRVLANAGSGHALSDTYAEVHRRRVGKILVGLGVAGILVAVMVSSGKARAADDQKVVADLDTRYQEAVKKNDAATMEKILADDFVLVTGSGKTFTKTELLNEARGGHMVYEHQDESDQVVRVWGDTAVVSARLWLKGTQDGKAFDRMVRFSDTYVRTPGGWRYVFGQSASQCAK